MTIKNLGDLNEIKEKGKSIITHLRHLAFSYVKRPHILYLAAIMLTTLCRLTPIIYEAVKEKRYLFDKVAVRTICCHKPVQISAIADQWRVSRIFCTALRS